jgi:DNA-binding beta-propeller fold protein YncE
MVSTIAGGMMGTTNAVGTMAKFLEPISVAYDAGQLYIADTQDNVIRVMDLTTMAVTTLVGLSGTAGEVNGDASMATFTSPIRLVADHIGNLYVTELNLLGNGATPGTIRRIDLSGPTVSTFAGVQGSYGVVPGPLPATMNEPFGLALTPTGDLLVGDIREEIVGLISAP